MYLCMDIGNSQIHCGVFNLQQELLLQFRHNTDHVGSSEQFALFLLNVLRENNIDPKSITKVAIASVVPSVDYSVGAAFIKYFKLTPIFLQAGIKTGIKIASNNPSEIGADLIAGALGGVSKYPKRHLLIFDFGTATTVSYITPEAEFIGGAILPGIRLMMESLQTGTAKLFTVNISQPKTSISKDTRLAIQAGLYYSQVGTVKEFIRQVCLEQQIRREDLVVIGTGGFANLLNTAQIFDEIVLDLLLLGLKEIIRLNQ